MNPDPTKAPPEEWLAHSRWLSKLARSLVVEEATADDLVQQTWFAALRNPPQRGRPARPWLARVLRNFAVQHRRSEAIRARYEMQSVSDATSPSAADVVARLESHRMLVEALLQLQEPYRETIVRHFLDGESSVDVARTKGVPAATVRWRLMRGLELLRDDLDRDANGDRRSWMVALAPLARSTTSSAPIASPAVPVIGGALAMQIGTKLGIATALLVALLAGAWWFASRSLRTAPARFESADVSAVPQRDGQSAIVTAADSEADRSTIATPGSPASSPPIGAHARVEGRVVDEQHRALPRARVRISNWSDAPASLTDDGGRFSFDLGERADVPDERQRTWAELEASCDRFVPEQLGFRAAFDRTTHLGELVLTRAGEVRGSVVDPEGRPVEDAEVFAQIVRDSRAAFPNASWIGRFEGANGLRFSVGAHVPRTRTRADGSFTFDALPQGFVRVWATKPLALAAFSEPLDVHAGEAHTLPPLQLDAPEGDHLIFGRVVAPDGSPVAGARVTQPTRAIAGTTEAKSGDDGRFFVSAPFTSAVLTVADPQKRWPQLAKRIPTGKDEVEIRFAAWQLLTVRAVDEAHAPVKRFGVSVARPSNGSEVFVSPIAEHPEGEVVVNVPHETFRLIVYGPGLEISNSDDLDPARVGELMQFQMRRGRGVGGRVLAGGAPVAGARVAMLRMLDGGRYKEIRDIGARPSPMLSRVLGINTLEEATTDAEGHFFLGLVAQQSLLRIEAPGRAPFLRWSITEPIGDLEIELRDGGAIEGRVEVAEGTERSGLLMGASCADGHVATCRTDNQGAYRFDRLSPGSWQVRRLEREQTPAEERATWMDWGAPVLHPEFDCEVIEGETCHYDLGASALETPRLQGRLVIDGIPAGMWSATLTKLAKQGELIPPMQRWLDSDGAFEFSVAESGDYMLDLQADPSKGPSLHVCDRVTIGRGTQAWDADIRTAILSGTPDPTILDGAWHYAVTPLGGDRSCFSHLQILNGRFPPTLVCAGKVRIVRLDDELGVIDSPTVKTIEVRAGDSIEFSIP